MEEPRKIKRYFTQADYEAGLCDKNGKPLPGGPAEPPKKSVNNATINDDPGPVVVAPEDQVDLTAGEEIPGASAAR